MTQDDIKILEDSIVNQTESLNDIFETYKEDFIHLEVIKWARDKGSEILKKSIVYI